MAALKLDLEWRITLFTALLFPALVALGFWQLERADEKRELESRWAQRQSEAPVRLSELAAEPAEALAYRRVHLRGEFLPGYYLLLDNRMYRGRYGNEVVGLFRLADTQRLVLVNRGWVASDPARLTLPDVPEPAGVSSVTGHLYVSPGTPYLLAEQQLAPPWPVRIQAVDMQALQPLVATVSDAELYPWLVRIDPNEPAALTADWPVVNASPEKHQGYAVQWFTMAAVLLLFFLLRSSNLWQLITRRED
jgi:cytochrome oxidase assembly protein ShyY1